MADGFLLTPRDRELINEILAEHRRRVERNKVRNLPPDELDTPEHYIALTPDDGIPALEPGEEGSENTGTGMGSIVVPSPSRAIPGSAECRIFRLVREAGQGDEEFAYLEEVEQFSKVVYNLSLTAVAGDTWVHIIREKYGPWWALAPAGDGDAGGGGGGGGADEEETVQHFELTAGVVTVTLTDATVRTLVLSNNSGGSLDIKYIVGGTEARQLFLRNEGPDEIALIHTATGGGTSTDRQLAFPDAENLTLYSGEGVAFTWYIRPGDTVGVWHLEDLHRGIFSSINLAAANFPTSVISVLTGTGLTAGYSAAIRTLTISMNVAGHLLTGSVTGDGGTEQRFFGVKGFDDDVTFYTDALAATASARLVANASNGVVIRPNGGGGGGLGVYYDAGISKSVVAAVAATASTNAVFAVYHNDAWNYGASGTVNGLVFVGGIYVSGAFALSDITGPAILGLDTGTGPPTSLVPDSTLTLSSGAIGVSTVLNLGAGGTLITTNSTAPSGIPNDSIAGPFLST